VSDATIRQMTAAAVLLVAAIAAVISFTHIRYLAATHGGQSPWGYLTAHTPTAAEVVASASYS
jgi:hypothetical protein